MRATGWFEVEMRFKTCKICAGDHPVTELCSECPWHPGHITIGSTGHCDLCWRNIQATGNIFDIEETDMDICEICGKTFTSANDQNLAGIAICPVCNNEWPPEGTYIEETDMTIDCTENMDVPESRPGLVCYDHNNGIVPCEYLDIPDENIMAKMCNQPDCITYHPDANMACLVCILNK